MKSGVSDPARWDAHWVRLGAKGRVQVNPELTSAISDRVRLEGSRVLEVGAGSGGDSAHLSARGARVVVLDISRPGLDLAAYAASQAGVSVMPVQADGFELPFPDGCFDVVFHQGLLEHFRDPIPLLEEQVRVLKPGGILVCDAPQTFSALTIRKHVLMWLGRWFAGWETQYTIGQLTRLYQRVGLRPVARYGRGYAPRMLYRLRHLHGLVSRRTRHTWMPSWFWRAYDRSWDRFESTNLALRVQESIGIVGVKDPRESVPGSGIA